MDLSMHVSSLVASYVLCAHRLVYSSIIISTGVLIDYIVVATYGHRRVGCIDYLI